MPDSGDEVACGRAGPANTDDGNDAHQLDSPPRHSGDAQVRGCSYSISRWPQAGVGRACGAYCGPTRALAGLALRPAGAPNSPHRLPPILYCRAHSQLGCRSPAARSAGWCAAACRRRCSSPSLHATAAARAATTTSNEEAARAASAATISAGVCACDAAVLLPGAAEPAHLLAGAVCARPQDNPCLWAEGGAKTGLGGRHGRGQTGLMSP
jgi:hypothetical protein